MNEGVFEQPGMPRRERRTAARALINSIWRYQRYRERRGLIALILRRIARLQHEFWSIVTGSDVRPQAQLGRGLRLPHPTGVVIHQDAKVGPDCIIMQQVTLGQLSTKGAPVLEAGVYVGAGAKILGSVRIGRGARIGANAVVLRDVPAGCTAVGVPARIVKGPPQLTEADEGARPQGL